jgi:hypothetical protein
MIPRSATAAATLALLGCRPAADTPPTTLSIAPFAAQAHAPLLPTVAEPPPPCRVGLAIKSGTPNGLVRNGTDLFWVTGAPGIGSLWTLALYTGEAHGFPLDATGELGGFAVDETTVYVAENRRRPLAKDEAPFLGNMYLPEGRILAFSKDGRLLRTVASGLRCIQSPVVAGRTLYWGDCEDHGVFSVDAFGEGHPTRLTPIGPMSWSLHFRLFVDGSRLFYHDYSPYVLPITGGEPRLVPRGPRDSELVAMDATDLYLAVNRDMKAGLVRMPKEGGEPTVVPTPILLDSEGFAGVAVGYEGDIVVWTVLESRHMGDPDATAIFEYQRDVGTTEIARGVWGRAMGIVVDHGCVYAAFDGAVSLTSDGVRVVAGPRATAGHANAP